MAYNVFVVAGEASADVHAAALVREFKRLHPETHFFGVGGTELEKEGMEVLVPSSQLSLVGISDWFDRAGEVLSLYRKVKNEVRRRRPDLAILLDLPDFNLSIAKHLKAVGTPITYYISPQVWAWRKYRIKKIQRLVDQMLVVFPFEKDFYAKHGVDVTFVGHPLLEQIQSRDSYRDASSISTGPRVAILPGSRPSEIRYHGPCLEETILQLKKDFPDVQIRIPVAPTLKVQNVKDSLGRAQDLVQFWEGHAHEILKWADAALIASGTATLECALIGTPFCLFYKASPSSAWVFKHLVRYRNFIGMPNLLHKEEVVKEFFQEKAKPVEIAGEIGKLLRDSAYRSAMAKKLVSCRKLLGTSGASQKVAHLARQNLLHSIEQHRAHTVLGGNHAPEAT